MMLIDVRNSMIFEFDVLKIADHQDQPGPGDFSTALCNGRRVSHPSLGVQGGLARCAIVATSWCHERLLRLLLPYPPSLFQMTLAIAQGLWLKDCCDGKSSSASKPLCEVSHCTFQPMMKHGEAS